MDQATRGGFAVEEVGLFSMVIGLGWEVTGMLSRGMAEDCIAPTCKNTTRRYVKRVPMQHPSMM